MVILEESPWYREILQRGQQEGRQEGRQEEAAALVLRQLSRRLTQITPELQQQIRGLSVEHLEALGEALLDFKTDIELRTWLANLPDVTSASPDRDCL
jgi:predicted transposase YdaD